MTLHVALTHRTSYRYDRAVDLGPQTIRLRPAPHARTPIIAYSLTIEPDGHFINWQQDPQSNFLARIILPQPVTHFQVIADLVADLATINPFDFFLDSDAENWPFTYDHLLDTELAPFRIAEDPGPQLAALLRDIPRHRQRTIDMLVALNHRVPDRVAYIVRLEPGIFTPEQTLEDGGGSCRDSAWLLVQALRHLGYAARFVPGYLIQLKPDVRDAAPGPTADFTDLHAWAETYLPGAGRIGLAATSGLLTGEGRIPLAASPEPASAAAISDLVGPAEVEFDVAMSVVRIHETPRVTRPYAEPTWQAILQAGNRIDQALAAADVRLTMGGEPTFVSLADNAAGERNTKALGPTKRLLSGRLIRRVAKLWSPGAALQYAAGKHYLGERLPRWALNAHWRRDGEPVWLDPQLLAADEDRIGSTVRHVDSSVERLQARVTGFTPDRTTLACNGRAVPPSATDRQGEYVAGIRFKAWAAAMSLHPTIPAQTPIVVELRDNWTGRSLGGISHHVAHPGGRNYENFPVNAAEAEARRRARFFPFGHSAGPTPPPRATTALEHPCTRDLRRRD